MYTGCCFVMVVFPPPRDMYLHSFSISGGPFKHSKPFLQAWRQLWAGCEVRVWKHCRGFTINHNVFVTFQISENIIYKNNTKMWLFCVWNVCNTFSVHDLMNISNLLFGYGHCYVAIWWTLAIDCLAMDRLLCCDLMNISNWLFGYGQIVMLRFDEH